MPVIQLNLNILTLLLVGTGIFAPSLFLWGRRLNLRNLDATCTVAARYWLYFLALILLVRALAGLGLMTTDVHVYGIAKFYPIRIAYPNYQLLQGLPYLALCLGVLVFLPRMAAYISRSRWKYFLLWCFSAVVLLSFGGIHGGIVSGNIGVSDSRENLADASLNATAAETFATHTDRIKGLTKPQYEAPHSMSHPAGAVVYWQVVARNTTPFMFSVINVLCFSLAFAVVYWALRRRFDDTLALQSVLACLLIPGLLIYGRSDDAVYYSIAAICMALIDVALREGRYRLTAAAAAMAGVAVNFSYASFVLLPAMFSLNADVRLERLFVYLRRITPHALIVVSIVISIVVIEARITGFDLISGFRASVQHNAGSNIVALLSTGEYLRIVNDRIMAVFDFLIFAGPLFLFLFARLAGNASWDFRTWQLKNFALGVLMSVLAVNSNGPGEVSRPWGSLFLLIAYCWVVELLRQEREETRWWLIRAQLTWALFLQVPLNFGW